MRFTPAAGGETQSADAVFYVEEDDLRCNVYTYADDPESGFSTDGTVSFSGDTITLDLRITNGDDAGRFTGKIVLTAQP
jgi:hypothetical protein